MLTFTVTTGPADFLREKLVAHRDAVKRLESMLREQCGREGHVWDVPAGRVSFKTREEWDRDSLGPYVSGYETTTYYTRTCTRCGLVESQPAVKRTQKLHPFTGTSV